MFIKYDEIELMEFFESEPIFIGDEEAGECMYVRRQGDFKIILVISTYEMYIKVSVSYKENVIVKNIVPFQELKELIKIL